jgi:predicted  nucleic acid-binding Zn-ribbon protein
MAAAEGRDREGGMSVLDKLLVVQEHDTALDRLRYRREALPERSQLAAREADAAKVSSELATLQRARDDASAEEKRLDDEARSIDARAKEMEQRLYSGTISSPRELQAMQADIDMLRRQREGVDDNELEFMERRDDLDRQVSAADTTLSELQAEIERLRSAIADAEHEIDGEIAQEEAARRDEAVGIPDTVVADYERRRVQNRGAGAARLIGDTCQGCHLSIPSTEVERIRRAPDGSVAYCDNCGCILVPA